MGEKKRGVTAQKAYLAARDRWYGSNEHFNTEKSYEEHLEDMRRKRQRKMSLFDMIRW